MSAIIVMGVSGCGKSTLGRALAEALGGVFVEADMLHSAQNVAKMAAGTALDDEDRWPWLALVGAALAPPGTVVVACSALKRAYRDFLTDTAGRQVRFVFIELDRPDLVRRIQQREGHYMPASLLDSQLTALEPPAAEENAVRVVRHQHPWHRFGVVN